MELLLTLGLLWIIGLLAASLRAQDSTPRSDKSWRYAIAIIVLIALVVRLVPNFLLPVDASYDIDSFNITAQLLANGQDVYSAPEAVGRHPYLPLQMYWMRAAQVMSISSGLAFPKVVRLLPIMADALIAGLVFFILQEKNGDRKAWQGAIFYALNPITVLVTSYHGQFDSIPTLLILLAWMSWKRFSTRGDLFRGGVSATLLGLAILIKSWPILFLPVMLMNQKDWKVRISYSLQVTLPSLIAISIYSFQFNSDFITILTPVITYNHGIGIWGYTYFIKLGEVFGLYNSELINWMIGNGRWITLGIMGILYWRQPREWSAIKSFLAILQSFFAFTHAFSIQYLSWVIPFAVIAKQRLPLKRFLLAASAYMIMAYFTLILSFRIAELIPWPLADIALIIQLGIPAWLIGLHWYVKGLTKKGIDEACSDKVCILLCNRWFHQIFSARVRIRKESGQHSLNG